MINYLLLATYEIKYLQDQVMYYAFPSFLIEDIIDVYTFFFMTLAVISLYIHNWLWIFVNINCTAFIYHT